MSLSNYQYDYILFRWFISKGIQENFKNVSKNFNSVLPLMTEVLKNSRVHSTAKSYQNYSQKWRIRCDQFPEALAIPADEIYIILHLLIILFMGFFRFSKVINLNKSDITLQETHTSIFIEKKRYLQIRSLLTFA